MRRMRMVTVRPMIGSAIGAPSAAALALSSTLALRIASPLAMAKDLKRRGWKFVGPTTVYAFMQAMRLVNDHREGCDAREVAERARERFERP
jgi:DNA-3-methyladenine glycosylase I